MRRPSIFLIISACTLVSVFALTEEEYRETYPFAVDAGQGRFEDHPSDRYRVFTLSGVRECDIKDGDVCLIVFYDGDDLIRSYSLKQLFPDREDWRFHPATGVFMWPLFNPKMNGFHGDNYTILTISGVRTFDVTTGQEIIIAKKQKKTQQPTPDPP